MRKMLRRGLCVLLCVFCLVLPLAQAALAYETLEKGDKGAQVLRMQQRLIALGYSLDADGSFGKQTRAAVMAYQAANGLKADGKAGNLTLSKLYGTPSGGAGSTENTGAAGSGGSTGSGVIGSATVYVQDGGKLNLREKPQRGAKVLGRIPSGDAVALHSKGGAWCKVEYNGEAGYVMASYLRFGDAPQTTPSASQPQTTPQPSGDAASVTVKTADGGKLNLREKAQRGSKVLGRIPNGAALSVRRVNATWSATTYAGQSGYVMNAYLTTAAAPPTITQTPESAQTPVITPSPTPEITPTPTPTATPGVPAGYARVTSPNGGDVNLRKGKGTHFDRIYQLPVGSDVAVLDADGAWCRVRVGKYTGYVQRQYLIFGAGGATATPSPTETPPAATGTPAPAAPSGVIAIVNTENQRTLNFRREPVQDKANIIAQIPHGTYITVTTHGFEWCEVVYNGETGYVMTSMLLFPGATATPPPPTQTPPAATDTPAPASPSGVIAIVNTENQRTLNFRREPVQDKANIMAQIPHGTYITVTTHGFEWCEVVYNGETGYVMTAMLLFPGATATPPPAAPDEGMADGEYRYATVKTTNGSLNLRAGPGEEHKKVAEIPENTLLVVTGMAGDWCETYYGEKTGYVMRQYLVFGKPPDPAQEKQDEDWDTAALTRTLSQGDAGEDVRLVQTRLATLQYPAAVTGTYDAATVTAVKLFQKMHALTQDGKAGANTFARLFAIDALPYTPESGSYKNYLIDSSGDAIRRAQQALKDLNYNVTVTGSFDVRLHNALVAFQLRNGVTATGVLDVATQVRLYSGSAKDVSASARYYLEKDAGLDAAKPGDIQLLHWQNDVKSALTGSSQLTIRHPATGYCWTLNVYARGRHCDCQPTTLRDTLIMNRAFGGTSWTIHPVYVLLPDGRWTLATMHNRPHEGNSIMANGFGGHLCVHFLRDMSEAIKNDPDYGVSNQQALRKAWLELTGNVVQ